MPNDIDKLTAMQDAVKALREDNTCESLGELLVCAMMATIDHPNCPSEEQQLKAAIGAVMNVKGYASPESNLLAKEIRWLGSISPILIGCSDTLLSILPPPTDFTPIILTLWRVTRHAKRSR